MLQGWRLYYGDGSTFSHEDGTWAQAPSEDVQVLLFWTDAGPTLSHGQDEPYRLPGRKSVKHGRTIGDEEYERLLRRAYRDAADIHEEIHGFRPARGDW